MIDNLVGNIVSYGNKVWLVRFPIKDANGEIVVKSCNSATILKGLEEHKSLFGEQL